MTPCGAPPLGIGQLGAGHLDPHRFPPPVGCVQDYLGQFRVAGETVPDRSLELIHRQADIEIQKVPALHFLGTQPPPIFCPVVPLLDMKITVQHYHAAAQAGENRLQKAVQPAELAAPLTRSTEVGITAEPRAEATTNSRVSCKSDVTSAPLAGRLGRVSVWWDMWRVPKPIGIFPLRAIGYPLWAMGNGCSLNA